MTARTLVALAVAVQLPIAAGAERIVTTVEAGLTLAPGETREVSVTADPDHDGSSLFWSTIAGTREGRDCTSEGCVRAAVEGFGEFETFNMSLDFDSRSDVKRIRFTNLADTPVTIRVDRIAETCSAQSCELVAGGETTGWIVFRIQQLHGLETSADASYSRIEATTVQGRRFEALLVWWRHHEGEALGCHRTIPRWIEQPEKNPPPYVIAGSLLTPRDANGPLVALADTCSAKATSFNAPREDDFDFRTGS